MDLFVASISFGGYISIIKFIVFVAAFIAWLPLVSWIHNDSKPLEINTMVWSLAILCTGAIALFAWLLIPVYLAGLILFSVMVGTVSLIYIKQRNAMVLDIDRVLTIDHMKNIFVSKEKKLESLQEFIFITSNKNDVPIPEPRTTDFFGYKTVYEIIKDASWRRASTVALSPTPQEYQIAYNIDGSVTKQPSIPKDQAEHFLTFIKQLSDLDIKEKRKPQKGIFRVHKKDVKKDTIWEVTTAGSTAGEQVRLKKITQGDPVRVDMLGLMPEQIELLSNLKQRKQGLFVISGPEKSGVSTTLYAMLRNHDAFMNSINTLEKQPSEPLQNITQNTFTLTDTGSTTFAKKLLSIVRMGSDVLGISDCEDADTARVACAAAKDGSVVYLVMKADSVVQALNKLIKYVGDRKVLAQSLMCISNQRLIRNLCDTCKEAYAPDKELLRKFNISAEKTKALYRAGKVVYDKRGKPSTCEHCQGTGYYERTAVFEMIGINNELAKVIQTQPMPEIAKQFRRAKMLYMQEQMLRRVISGTTTINEMIRILQPKSKPSK
ncbi:MAG: Flp pilus assembly complex ATPase component TadA [Sedimentisphaerales bacterium]|nr:Flp pilus assembly complex ATPase component TadA [Sedimentisphaerales bacterium]